MVCRFQMRKPARVPVCVFEFFLVCVANAHMHNFLILLFSLPPKDFAKPSWASSCGSKFIPRRRRSRFMSPKFMEVMPNRWG